ncbi:tryptophan synthase subunit alpha [Pirellulales bacterium]|jgi:tryptophan synthase alpha chain|nr:tryptophan synthase subunit alpha [Pirellulales bacterium]MDB4475518.1 tryptophan synthase subunit alpha [Pirellulales bacterium]
MILKDGKKQTGIERLEDAFAQCKSEGRRAVSPFITAGDPDSETTVATLKSIFAAGATCCELGVPYSDPIADGAVIQSSYTRALNAGMNLKKMFGIVSKLRETCEMPLLAMVSYSLIFRSGIEAFVKRGEASGLAGFVVPDLPLEESDDLDAHCRQSGLALVRLVSPTTPPERAREIARRSTGFLYCVSVAGVTGERTALPDGLIDRIKWLRQESDVPILVGFGISSADQAREVAAVADGVIVGSAVVRCLEQAKDAESMPNAAGSFVQELVKACQVC